MDRRRVGEPVPIGEVFTPVQRGIGAVRYFGLLEKWLAGASVLDPTMGTGNLLEALIAAAVEDGHPPGSLPVHNLFGIELRPSLISDFLRRVGDRFGIFPPPANFSAADFMYRDGGPICDILFGNPPWLNFTDLPGDYKNGIKQKFIDYGLVKNLRDVLLGGSRIDFSALIVIKAVLENLRPRGEAVFFLPLSLIMNDGANARFRAGMAGNVPFRIETVFDFEGEDIFPGVATRYGLFHIKRDEIQKFPVPCLCRAEESADFKAAGPGSGGFRGGFGGRRTLYLRPFPGPGDPWIAFDGDGGLSGDGGLPGETLFKPIEVARESLPRQGINTSGANDLFFFDDYREIRGTEDESQAEAGCILANSAQKDVRLPKKYVHPLITGANFSEKDPRPRKWVFLPHGTDGRPLLPEEVEGNRFLKEYLGKHRERLSRRKGVLINGFIQKGRFWALLGVGPYCFFPWKIVWQAYGAREFVPRIFPGEWQGNQALQCYMPFRDKPVCTAMLELLGDGRVSAFLKAAKMEGTMNWAQPGKVKRLLRPLDPVPLLIREKREISEKQKF